MQHQTYGYLRNPSLMDYYSFNRPRRDGWLSWPCWLTGSGRFTHKVVTRPAISLARDRESSPARTGSLTTMLRHQLVVTGKRSRYIPTTQPPRLSRVGKSSTGALAGVTMGHVHLCRVAGNSVILTEQMT